MDSAIPSGKAATATIRTIIECRPPSNQSNMTYKGIRCRLGSRRKKPALQARRLESKTLASPVPPRALSRHTGSAVSDRHKPCETELAAKFERSPRRQTSACSVSPCLCQHMGYRTVAPGLPPRDSVQKVLIPHIRLRRQPAWAMLRAPSAVFRAPAQGEAQCEWRHAGSRLSHWGCRAPLRRERRRRRRQPSQRSLG